MLDEVRDEGVERGENWGVEEERVWWMGEKVVGELVYCLYLCDI